jgi:hypothetical protein
MLRGLHFAGAGETLSVEAFTLKGLITQYVPFFIDIASRSVHIAGITPHPDSSAMTQIARNITDVSNGFLWRKRYLNFRFPTVGCRLRSRWPMICGIASK